jgi:putative Mn2+ efflux pump MntP
MHAFSFVVEFGLDSYLAGLAVGSFAFSERHRLRLAFAFGACDAAATLAGSLWAHRLQDFPALPIYLLCAFLVARAVRSNRALLYPLPVLLSVDNFFSGNPASTAPALGFGSAVFVLLGLSVAAAFQRVFHVAQAEV